MRRSSLSVGTVFFTAVLTVATVPSTSAGLGRLLLDQSRVPVDAPVCVCAEGEARPVLLHLDGKEYPSLELSARPAGGDSARFVHLALPWPETGPLVLWKAVEPRPRTRDLPMWDQDGTLGPGEYVLSANSYASRTLRVREPTAGERRVRALLARARLAAERGDSTLAARIVDRLIEREGDGAYSDAAFLASGKLLAYSGFRERPEGWLAEWVARHHARCEVWEGIRVWLEGGGPGRREALARIVSRYPDTRAAEAARQWLAATAKAAR